VGAGVAAVVLVGLGGCGRPHPGAGVTHREQIESAAYRTQWATRAPVRRGDAVKSCYLVDDNLYVLTHGGDVFALHAEHGLLRWGASLTERDYTVYPPTHLQTPDGHGPVLFVTTTRLWVLDRYSGDVLLSVPTPFPPSGSGVGDERRLYLGSTDGHVYSLAWKHALGTEPKERWRVMVGSPVAGGLVWQAPDDLYFATQTGAVVRCGARQKSFGWVQRVGGNVVADVFVDDTGVYAASLDRSLYRLEEASGAVLWRCRFADPLRSSPVTVHETCYQFNERDGLSAVDINTGLVRWQRGDGLSVVGAAPGEVVVRTSGGAIEVLDAATGATQRGFDASDARVAACNLRDSAVYLAAGDGRVECLRPEGVPYLRQQEVAASRAQLNRAPRGTDELIAPPPALPPAHDADPLRSSVDRRP